MPVKRSSKRARDGEGSGGVAWPLVLVGLGLINYVHFIYCDFDIVYQP